MTEGQFFSGASGFFQDVAIGPGELVLGGGRILNSLCAPFNPGNSAFISLEFFDAAGVQISNIQSPTAASATDIYEIYKVTAVTPPNTAFVRIVGVHVHLSLIHISEPTRPY